MSLSESDLQNERSWFGLGTVVEPENENIWTRNLSSEMPRSGDPGTSRTCTLATAIGSMRERFGRTLYLRGAVVLILKMAGESAEVFVRERVQRSSLSLDPVNTSSPSGLGEGGRGGREINTYITHRVEKMQE